MNVLPVDHFPSGGLVYFPSGATTSLATIRYELVLLPDSTRAPGCYSWFEWEVWGWRRNARPRRASARNDLRLRPTLDPFISERSGDNQFLTTCE
jgi:hypothetical protein